MRKNLVVVTVLFFLNAFTAFAQNTLAILPFTGGQGAEGETIAELFSFEPRLGEVFSIIPRTSISLAISNERRFQMGSGMTDPDTVVSIANEVGARYVVAGSITSVGNNNLLVISILDIRNLQQIAGDFQTYPQGRIEDLRGRLPGMAENIIRATRNNTAALPKLAIVPVQLEGGTDRRVADTLAQLLAIHLIRSGKYAVFPRTGSLEQVQAEHDAQMSGHTADGNVIGIGHGENPDYVLSVVARRLGSVNMFNAVIINLLTRVQAVGRSVDYQDINDGMRAMETLSVVLTGTTAQTGQRQQAEEGQESPVRTRRPRERDSDRSAGFGVLFDIGSGNSDIGMNPGYSYFGAFGFISSRIFEFSLGIAGGNIDVGNTDEGYFWGAEYEREWQSAFFALDFRFLWRIPFTVHERISIFPLFGLGIDLLSVQMLREEWGLYDSLGFSSIKFQLGGGGDFYLSENIFIRLQLLGYYGLPLGYLIMGDMYSNNIGGFAAKIGLGFRL